MKQLIIFLSISIILTACEQGTKPVQEVEDDYLPLEIGNYWIYKTYEIDPNSILVPNTTNIDSVVIEEKYELKSLMAYKAIVYRQKAPIDTLIFGKWKKEIHQLFYDKNADIPFMQNTWFRIADLEQANWHIYNTIRVNIDFDFFGDSIKVDADYTFNGEYIGKETLPIGTNDVLCSKYTVKPDRRYRFKYIFNESSPPDISTITVTCKQFIHRWFSKQIGIIRYQQDPYSYVYAAKPVVPSFPGRTESRNGYVMELMKFGLKQ